MAAAMIYPGDLRRIIKKETPVFHWRTHPLLDTINRVIAKSNDSKPLDYIQAFIILRSIQDFYCEKNHEDTPKYVRTIFRQLKEKYADLIELAESIRKGYFSTFSASEHFKIPYESLKILNSWSGNIDPTVYINSIIQKVRSRDNSNTCWIYGLSKHRLLTQEIVDLVALFDSKYQVIIVNVLVKLKENQINAEQYIETLKTKVSMSIYKEDSWKEGNWTLYLENKKLLTQYYVDFIVEFWQIDMTKMARTLVFLKYRKMLTEENIKICQSIGTDLGVSPIYAATILGALEKAGLLKANIDFFKKYETNDDSIFTVSHPPFLKYLSRNLVEMAWKKELTEQAFSILKKCCKSSNLKMVDYLYEAIIPLNTITLTDEETQLVADEIVQSRGHFIDSSPLACALKLFDNDFQLTRDLFDLIKAQEGRDKIHIVKLMKLLHKQGIDLSSEQILGFLSNINNVRSIYWLLLTCAAFAGADFAANLEQVITHQAIFSQVQSRTWNMFPPGAFEQTQFTALVRLCEAHEGTERDLVRQINHYLYTLTPGWWNIPELEGPRLNHAQSVHVESIHKSASHSAARLYEQYQEQLKGHNCCRIIKEMRDWIDDLGGEDSHHLTMMLRLPSPAEHPAGVISIITPEGLYQLDENNHYELILNTAELRRIQLGRFLEQSKALQQGEQVSIGHELTAKELKQLDSLLKSNPDDDRRGKTRSRTVLVDEKSIARRCIKRLTDPSEPGYDFVDELSKVSTQHLLAMVWLGLKDSVKDKHCDQATAEAKFLQGLHQIQRQYNLTANSILVEEKHTPDTAIEEDLAIQEDSPACVGGTFNFLVDILNTIHPAVEIIVHSHAYVVLKFPHIFAEQTVIYLEQQFRVQGTSKALELITQMEKESNDLRFEGSHWEAIKRATLAEIMAEFSSVYPGAPNNKKLQDLFEPDALEVTCDTDAFYNVLKQFQQNPPQVMPPKTMPLLVPDDDFLPEKENENEKGKVDKIEKEEERVLPLEKMDLAERRRMRNELMPATAGLEEKTELTIVDEKKQAHIDKLEAYLFTRQAEAKTFTEDSKDLANRYNSFFAGVFNGFDAKIKVDTARKILRFLKTDVVSEFTERELAAANNKRLGDLVREIANDDLLEGLGLQCNGNQLISLPICPERSAGNLNIT